MTVQTLSAIRVIPFRAGAALSAFAYLHGTFHFIRMFQIIEASGIAEMTPTIVDQVAVFLLPISYLCLLAFGVDLLVDLKKWPVSAVWVNVIVPIVAIVGFIGFGGLTLLQQTHWVFSIELYSRYIFALPATLVAAYSLCILAKRLGSAQPGRLEWVFKLAGLVVLLYGVAAVINGEEQFAIPMRPEHFIETSAGLAAIRCILAICLVALLSDAFFIEIARVTKSLLRMREESATIVAHDLRNLAGIIQNSSEILAGVFLASKTTNDQSKLLSILINSSKTLNRLSTDMFDISLLDLNRIELQSVSSDLRMVVGDICKSNENSFVGRKINLLLSELPVMAKIDRERIDQILTNLLVNAAKYSHPDSEIAVSVSIEQSNAKITVTNKGEPLDAEDINSLFLRFYRAKNSNGITKGTGLGLAIVKDLVAAHGGEVFVKSEPSGLITFGFTLPLTHEAHEVKASREAAAASVSGVPASGVSVSNGSAASSTPSPSALASSPEILT